MLSREMTKQKKEPLFQMVKRDYIAPSKALLIRFAAVALALVHWSSSPLRSKILWKSMEVLFPVRSVPRDVPG